jgi:hypothetical protein
MSANAATEANTRSLRARSMTDLILGETIKATMINTAVPGKEFPKDACLLTLAAEFWGFNRAASPEPWAPLANRALLITSLLTLTAFVHYWMKKSQEVVLNASEIK